MTDERDSAPGARPETDATRAEQPGAQPTAQPLRVAEVFDGRGPHGGVLIKRPPVPDTEFEALTRYLTTAPVALATTRSAPDELSPGAGMAVPRAYHTDGYWIWPAAVGYYLHNYRLPPQPDLVAHIRARGYELTPVPEPVRQAAAAQMLEELAAARTRQQAQARIQAQAEKVLPQRVPPARTGHEQNAAENQAAAPVVAVAGAAAGTQLPAPATATVPATTQAPAAEAPAPVTQTTAPATAAPRVPAQDSAPAPESAPAEPPDPADAPSPTSSAEPLWRPEPVDRPTGEPADEPADTPTDGAPPVVPFSRALTEVGNRHAAWVYEQIEAFLAFMPVDEWSVDHDSRLYRQAGRQFAVDALGRLAEDGRWTWAWAEPAAWSADPRITERARELRAEGDALGIAEFATPVLDLSAIADADDAETAAEMLAWTVMGLAGARGYIGHSQDGYGRVYYLAFDEAIPAATPELGAVPHFLTQGVLKFEEDATDCVLGYIEHHGWDWSRCAEGIEVSATGLGSFTADLTVDGELTGISLH